MRLLLDSHALIWALDDPSKLSRAASAELKRLENDLLLSAGTIWEIAIKVGIGGLKLSLPYRAWMNSAIVDLGLHLLPVSIEYAELQSTLPLHHRDPFDRLIVAQALFENVPIVSADAQLDAYGIQRIW
jgi:PIN domain nuclease of toxin-antitoxin system